MWESLYLSISGRPSIKWLIRSILSFFCLLFLLLSRGLTPVKFSDTHLLLLLRFFYICFNSKSLIGCHVLWDLLSLTIEITTWCSKSTFNELWCLHKKIYLNFPANPMPTTWGPSGFSKPFLDYLNNYPPAPQQYIWCLTL